MNERTRSESMGRKRPRRTPLGALTVVCDTRCSIFRDTNDNKHGAGRRRQHHASRTTTRTTTTVRFSICLIFSFSKWQRAFGRAEMSARDDTAVQDAERAHKNSRKRRYNKEFYEGRGGHRRAKRRCFSAGSKCTAPHCSLAGRLLCFVCCECVERCLNRWIPIIKFRNAKSEPSEKESRFCIHCGPVKRK